MIEMVVDSIRVSLMNYQRVVILKRRETSRYLPIWIGAAEADAIALNYKGPRFRDPWLMIWCSRLSMPWVVRLVPSSLAICKRCVFCQNCSQSRWRTGRNWLPAERCHRFSSQSTSPIYAEEDVLKPGRCLAGIKKPETRRRRCRTTSESGRQTGHRRRNEEKSLGVLRLY